MKKFKIVLLFFSIIILTGCSGSYVVKVNDDLTVTEKISVNIKNQNGLYERAKKLFEDNDINEDQYEITQTDENLKIEYTNDYSSFLSYTINSKLYKQLYNDYNYNQDKDSISLKASGNLKLDSESNENIINDYNISLFQIELDTPFEVISNNSDEEYKTRYIWNLKSSDDKKNIEFKMSNKVTSNNYIYILVIISIFAIGVFFLVRFLNGYFKEKRV